jgi:dsDNA-binding SOS-regulon protein
MRAETARRHELNYVLETIGKIKQANSFDDIFDIADELSAWLRSRINAKVANEPAPGGRDATP